MERPKTYKKVLIVRFSSIGDIVLTSPVIRCIKRQLNCEVQFITKSKFRAVVEHNPNIDKLWTINKEITEILPQLKKQKFDLIIDLHKNLRSKRLILALGKKSVSFDKINIQKWLRVHTRVNFLPQKHLVDRYFEKLQSYGITNDGEGLSYHHGLTEYDVSELIPTEKYISIVLGATYFTKRIPIEKLKIVIENTSYKCVLLGGNDVKELGETLQSQYPTLVNCVNKLTLNQSAAFIQNSTFVVSGDTGLMHMAAAYKVPILVFWGSTAYELGMYPYYGKNHDIPSANLVNENINCSPCSKIGKNTCPKGHFKCMLDLSKSQIVSQMKKLE